MGSFSAMRWQIESGQIVVRKNDEGAPGSFWWRLRLEVAAEAGQEAMICFVVRSDSFFFSRLLMRLTWFRCFWLSSVFLVSEKIQ